jgi:hypothetical protein
MLSIVLSRPNLVHSLSPPNPSFEQWESVHDMRRRLNITYNYDPLHISHEYCRYLSEEECQIQDEGIGHAKLGLHGRQLSPSTGQNFRILVVLVRFSNHGNRVSDRSFFLGVMVPNPNRSLFSVVVVTTNA